ncbi:unnamed protein product [Orchesella dallaii]|uniref:DOMON domain-containing protein n=1 Tax=Orchesella dallaii TaxID=48710 RepID=A0ABP1QFI7_9HEXA
MGIKEQLFSLESFFLFMCMCLVPTPSHTQFTDNHNNVLVPSNTRQREVLEANGRVVVEWEINFDQKSITFDVTGETTGYLGFGLSPAGGMQGADIVIGGIANDGTSYFGDYHGEGDFAPRRDTSQDWRLISAFENTTHTFLRVTRLLDSCDHQDVPITNDTLSLIWALGREDDVTYHAGERGTVAMNLLDPPQPNVDISAFKSWEMTVDLVMPSEKSYAYWCTIYKGPQFGTKTHIVGFRPVLKGPLAVKHTHHFVIYRCTNPPGADANKIFGPFADVRGDNCYTKEAMARRPSQLCSAVLYVWGAGGKDMFLPEHVGYPVGEEKNEYFMLEIHYDNPQQVTDAKFSTGVEVFYTDKLRKYDAALMTIGHTVVASLMIPPQQKDFQIVGHCSTGCTNLAIPPEGMNIFNILMHTHLQGKKMRLRQFRNGTELPWVSNDEHYNFNYQKNRPLLEERRILPGDSLAFECHYDTTTRDKITTAGYSTRDEMCEAFIWYYPKLALESCASFFPIEELYKKFGIKDVEWRVGLEGGPQPIITKPASMANKTFSQVVNENTNWTPKVVEELQRLLVDSDHIAICSGKPPGSRNEPPPPPPGFKPENMKRGRDGEAPPFHPQGPPPKPITVNYPKLDQYYTPPQSCNLAENVIDS